jgi:signal transduction histidine kinase
MILQSPIVPCPDTRIMFAVSVVVVVSVVVFTAAVVVTLLRRSDRRRAEEEKVAAIGSAAARILHQIKNPLQSVVLNADILQDPRMAVDEETRREVCGSIVSESHRLVDMLDELSAYASGAPRKLNRTPLRLDRLLAQLIRHEQRDGVGPEVGLEGAPVTVAGDPYYLSQVFENLIRNAREALEQTPGGRITVRMRAAGAFAEIRVSDNGPGVPSDVARGLFQPFVSTKGKGMGLGLAICREIIEGHGGRLDLESDAAAGATFLIQLPVTDDMAVAETGAGGALLAAG